MELSWIIGKVLTKVVGLWRSLGPGARGFTLGALAGMALSAAISLAWPRHDPADRIALQNAKAALDSTRALAAKHDTLFARLLAQKDVEFTGAMAEVAKQRGDNAKLNAKLSVSGSVSHSTASHVVRGSERGRKDSGDGAGGVPSGKSTSGATSVQRDMVGDTLVLPVGQSVQGTVGVTVTAQPDTTLRFDWDARLRPSPINLEVGLGCGQDGPELLANGPPWTHVEIQPSEVAPEVCNPAVRVGVVRRGLEFVGAAAVTAGIVKGVITLVHLF